MFLEISQENPCTGVSFLITRLCQSCFFVNLAKFLRTPFLQKTSGRLLLYVVLHLNFESLRSPKFDFSSWSNSSPDWGSPTHADIIEFWNFLLRLKNHRSGEKSCADIVFEIFFWKQNCILFSCEKTLLNLIDDRKGIHKFFHTLLFSRKKKSREENVVGINCRKRKLLRLFRLFRDIFFQQQLAFGLIVTFNSREF